MGQHNTQTQATLNQTPQKHNEQGTPRAVVREGEGGLKGGFKSGWSSGYWRLESAFRSHAGVAKRLEGSGGRTEAVGAELTVVSKAGRGLQHPSMEAPAQEA